jgi:hypothetical protein
MTLQRRAPAALRAPRSCRAAKQKNAKSPSNDLRETRSSLDHRHFRISTMHRAILLRHPQLRLSPASSSSSSSLWRRRVLPLTVLPRRRGPRDDNGE